MTDKRDYKSFVVKPEHKIVKAATTHTDVAIDIKDEFKGKEFYEFVISDWDAWCNSEDETKVLSAVAKCEPDDEFDEMFGKDIAGMKLDYKIHSRLLRQYRRCKTDLEKLIVEIDKKMMYHMKKMWNISCDYKRVYIKED